MTPVSAIAACFYVLSAPVRALLPGTATTRSELEVEAGARERVWQKLTNVEDMYYVGAFDVAGVKVKPIMDTGSFELVLFGKDCTGCKDSTGFLDRGHASEHLHITDLKSSQFYGSGATISNASFGSVAVYPDENDSSLYQYWGQAFWFATEVWMWIPITGSFAGIFGLGPPASAAVWAQKNQATVSYTASSTPDEVKTAGKVVHFEKYNKPWLTNLGIEIFSVCMKPGVGQPGYIILADVALPESEWVAVTKSGFWDVPVSEIRIGNLAVSEDCTALMDTGTSLIGLPEGFYYKVVDLVVKLSAQYGCDDLTNWPPFTFKIGDKYMKLPPSSYVIKYDPDTYNNDNDDSHAGETSILRRAMPQFEGAHEAFVRRTVDNATVLRNQGEKSKNQECAAGVFSFDAIATSSEECSFLFGLPFFRNYYVTHKIDGATGQAAAMSFSTFDANCTRRGDVEMVASEPTSSSVPLVVNPEKLRFPTMASRRGQALLDPDRVARGDVR